MTKANILAFSVGPIGSAALGFFTLPIIAWFFSPADIGRLSMLQVAISLCVMAFALGLDQAFVREYYEEKNQLRLFKEVVCPGLTVLLVTSVGFICFSDVISRLLFGISNRVLTLLLIISAISALTIRFFSLLLRMQNRGLFFSLTLIIPKFVFLGLVIFYALSYSGSKFIGLAVSQTAAFFVSFCVITAVIFPYLKSSIQERVSKDNTKLMLKYGMPLAFSSIAFWGLIAIDKVFLRILSSFEDLGIYSVAVSFAAAAAILQNIFSTVWAPIAYKWAAEGGEGSKVDSVTEHVLAVVIFLIPLAGLFSWVLMYFLPTEYGEVRYIVVSCIIYPLFYTLSETTSIGITLARKSMLSAIASVTAVIVNVVLNYLLIPLYGAAGAGVSTAISFWVFLIMRTELSSYIWRVLPRKKLYFMTGVGLVMAISFTLVGDDFRSEFIYLWISLLAIWAVTFRRSLNALYRVLT